MGETRELKRWHIINNLIQERDYKSYLEIGIQYGDCYNRIKCDSKTGCDPYTYYRDETIELFASDKFFEICRREKRRFDIVFVDGQHEKEQFERDVKNALASLNKGGVVLCHDCNPVNQSEAKYPRTASFGRWNGNVYLGWINLRRQFDYLMYVLDTDEGTGVIEPDKIGMNLPDTLPLPSWDEFVKNKDMYLNLKEV